MNRIFYQQDCDLQKLANKTVAIIGYGSQGHAHALNLKESGVNVIVGLYHGSKSWAKAEAQGLTVMTAAEATVKEGGVIIMLAKSNDGIGGDHFYHQLADEPDIGKTMALFLSRGRKETVPDQWQTQILLRILQRNKVVYVSEMDEETVRKMHMTPAHSIEEALQISKELLKKEDIQVTAIPDGVSVIVR